MKARFARSIRGAKMCALLARLGIQPRQYWLLVDLFGQLSERGQMLDQLGRNGLALKTATWLYAAFSAFLGLFLALASRSVEQYMTISLAFTLVLMSSVLVAETANSLVNPEEAVALAHQPINGATYTAAKLSHLGRIVLYLVPALTALPALFGVALPGGRWWVPVVHLGVALGLGFTIALACCAVFGWLLRFMPARRIKGTAELIAALPLATMMTWQYIAESVRRIHLLPRTATRAVVLGIGTVIAIGFILGGLRSLSGDYLIRVSQLMRGGRSLGARSRRSWFGAIAHRLFGGQSARAGFAFTSRLMLRDYQFRRLLLPAALPIVLGGIPPLVAGPHGEPFSRAFTTFHVLPHIVGLLLFYVCLCLAYGEHHKGKWLFLLAPARALKGFAGGVHAVLWLWFVIALNAIAAVPLTLAWGAPHALLFTAFSIAVESVYLALELPLIEAIPFTRQPDPKRTSTMGLLLMLAALVVCVAVLLQWTLVFRSTASVLAATLLLGGVAYALTKRSVKTLEASMRFNLALTTNEAGAFYTEIEA